MDEQKLRTISVFTENRIGLLGRITIILTRRRMNIESITVSESEVPGVHRYTIVIRATREYAEKVTAQILKLVDVLKAFVHDEEEIVSQELALYKLSAGRVSRGLMEKVVRNHHARILDLDSEFVVIEKTGQRQDTESLRKDLEQYGLLEFSRSGQVTITRPMKALVTYLSEIE